VLVSCYGLSVSLTGHVLEARSPGGNVTPFRSGAYDCQQEEELESFSRTPEVSCGADVTEPA
jgi:hypothetical protein